MKILLSLFVTLKLQDGWLVISCIKYVNSLPKYFHCGEYNYNKAEVFLREQIHAPSLCQLCNYVLNDQRRRSFNQPTISFVMIFDVILLYNPSSTLNLSITLLYNFSIFIVDILHLSIILIPRHS